MEIARQIGSLVLEAIPAMVLVLILFVFLRNRFFAPLEKVLEERRARIEGARSRASAAEAAAEEKQRAYQEALRKAKSEIYGEQEAARRTALDGRTALLRETRNRSNETIRAAKSRIGDEAAAARTSLEKECETLAGEIARMVLERGAGPPAKGAQ